VTYQNIDQNIGDSDERVLSSDTAAGDFLDDSRVGGSSLGRQSQSWLSGSRGLLIGLALGLGLAFIGIRVSSLRGEPSAADGEAVEAVASATVTTVPAEKAPIRQMITTNGTVEAFDLLSVAPRAGGLQIQSVTVREGDRVLAGQTLAVLDDSVLRSQIAQADAQVNAAQAQVAQARAQAAQAEASLAEAQENFDRYSSLFDQGATSAEVLTSRRTQVTTAKQTVDSAYAGIESAEATVRSAQAEVSRLSTQLDQTLVLAPSDGVIAAKDATVGDTASTGTPLFQLISGDQLELAVKVPQSQLAQINVGTPVQIRSSSDSSLQLQGSVRSIDPTVDVQTRQATVKVGLPGSDKIRPGMFLQAAIVTGSRQGVTIPAEAVLPQSDGGFVVYTLVAPTEESGGKHTVRARSVDVGDRMPATADEPAKIEIVNGLEANVPVVVEGASYLQNSDVVDVVDAVNSGAGE